MSASSLLSQLADTAAEPRFAAAIAVATLAGLVRGFSGFGSALIYMPLISAIYGPRLAAPTLLLIDSICALPFALRAMPNCNKREVVPVSIAGAIALPLGALALLLVDAQILRWVIAVLVLIALATLAGGWRYQGRPTLAASLGVGTLAGLGAGAVQIGVPPLLVFWLGGKNNAFTVRANIMVYFISQEAISYVVYYVGGLFTVQSLTLAPLLGLPFLAALALGAFWFHGASEALYRRIAYLVIALAVLVSLPIFDGLH